MSKLLEELTAQEKKDLVGAVVDKKSGLSDRDWCEIVDDFDLGINAETLRKAGVGIKLAADAGMLGGASTANGYIERQKLRDLARQVNTAYRTQSRMAVTHGDKPFANIQQKITDLDTRQRMIWYKMARYNIL